jgi:hypothetical protein
MLKVKSKRISNVELLTFDFNLVNGFCFELGNLNNGYVLACTSR